MRILKVAVWTTKDKWYAQSWTLKYFLCFVTGVSSFITIIISINMQHKNENTKMDIDVFDLQDIQNVFWYFFII